MLLFLLVASFLCVASFSVVQARSQLATPKSQLALVENLLAELVVELVGVQGMLQPVHR